MSNHVGTVYECDRQTDEQTAKFTMTKTALCIALRGNNRKIEVELDNAIAIAFIIFATAYKGGKFISRL